MNLKYCEDCSSKMSISKRRTLKSGRKTIQYKCNNCSTYETYPDEEVIETTSESIPIIGGPRILIMDIETSPIEAFVWGIWQQNVAAMTQIMEDWHLLTWSAKWLGQDEIFHDSLHLHKDAYNDDRTNDGPMLQRLWDLLDEADMIVAHNGDRFDIPKINARFLLNGMNPPSPYKRIDTLKIMKYSFRMTSNKLDYIVQLLGIGAKVSTGGMQLWIDCRNGDMDAFDRMLKYNDGDILILEELYVKLIPWMRSHPNVGVYINDDTPMCTGCGSGKMNPARDKHGHKKTWPTNLAEYDLYLCDNCGRYARGRVNKLSKAKRASLLTNVI